MRRGTATLELPAKLVDELGDHGKMKSTELSAATNMGHHLVNRKSKGRHGATSRDSSRPTERSRERWNEPPPPKRLKRVRDDEENSHSQPGRLSKKVAQKLADDDAEIEALEKKLGIRGKKSLPKAFKDDGLDFILGGLEDGAEPGLPSSDEDFEDDEDEEDQDEGVEDTLSTRRQQPVHTVLDKKAGRGKKERRAQEHSFSAVPEGSRATLSADEEVDDGTDELDDASIPTDEFTGFDSEIEDSRNAVRTGRQRENPYVAPVTEGSQSHEKYIPPSLRAKPSSESQSLLQLRRRTQGLVNRLTDSNLLTILSETEGIYRDMPRKDVMETLVDTLLISLCQPTSLPDTSIITPAAFIAAVYKVMGSDFGAFVIQRIVELFETHHRIPSKPNGDASGDLGSSSKETSNLITLLSELYNFHVIGSNLVYDYLRLFLSDFSEINVELILRIIRISGMQLRQDDPSSLKDVVQMLRAAVSGSEESVSVRTKFLIETINDLKNNRMKTGAAASSVILEHRQRLKKILGTLSSRTIKATEPMGIGLQDVQQADKRGKWWLVGASWSGTKDTTSKTSQPAASISLTKADVFSRGEEDDAIDLHRLAREQRMNTDVRRGIFMTIMSSSDYQDAYMRLLKLSLKKAQEQEIPKVLVHCVGAELAYNPYYTLIAQKLCGERRLRMAFQFALWDIFRRLGENDDLSRLDEAFDDEESLTIRQLANLGKMFGSLVASDALNLTILKKLNMAYLQPRTQAFVEVLLITVMLESQTGRKDGHNKDSVSRIFSKVRDVPDMVQGLQYFIRKVVVKSDIAEKSDKPTLKRACKAAGAVLDSLLTDVPGGP
jgi:nucleolar MIF4G domain-containing protein 1